MGDQATPRIGIVVLGMHRSGTSALTRTLALLGAALPTNVMETAHPANPTGHWEPDRLVDIHNRMFDEAQSSWFDWRGFDPAELPSERTQAYRNEIVSCLEDEYGASDLFVLKDPRTARMVPLYADILGSMGVEARYVLCLRNPIAVAASLAARDAWTPAFGALMWLRHVLDSEFATRGLPRSIVSYEALMDDWRNTVASIARSLQIEWPSDIDEAAPAIETFLQRELRHHHASAEDLGARPEMKGWVTTAYEAMRSLLRDEADAAARVALDGVRSEFEPMAELFGNAALPGLLSRDRHIVALNDERERESERAAAAEQRASDAEAAFDSIVNSHSWRITGPLREARRRMARVRPPTDS